MSAESRRKVLEEETRANRDQSSSYQIDSIAPTAVDNYIWPNLVWISIWNVLFNLNWNDSIQCSITTTTISQSEVVVAAPVAAIVHCRHAACVASAHVVVSVWVPACFSLPPNRLQLKVIRRQ